MKRWPELTAVTALVATVAIPDPSLLRGIAFTAGQPVGTFRFRLDRVEVR